MVQLVHIDVEVHEIEEIAHKEEGGFLGMGKDDIIELVFAASADHSRARFHLKGQDSSDWAAMIKRVQTGDIDEDRSDEYIDEFGKNFREIIPVSDLADLLVYCVHLKKVKNIELDGFEYLLEYENGGIDEMDQYAFTNVLLYVDKSKQPEIEF